VRPSGSRRCSSNLDTTASSTTGATVNVLFGSIFTLPASMVPFIAIFSVVAAGIVLVMYRPLILTSVSADLAIAQGIRVRLVGIGYLVALALAVSLSAVTIGAILSTALLIGPAATALRHHQPDGSCRGDRGGHRDHSHLARRAPRL